MKIIYLGLLVTMLAAGMVADDGHHRDGYHHDGHHHDGSIIVVDEYPEEVVYEVHPANDRLKQWQAIFARGETGGADFRDQQKKRNVDVINSLLALPKGMNAAGRR